MNILLIFFAFPLAVIIVSIILQKLLNNPFSVAALIFAIFIVVTFAAFDETFLIATLAYTILAFITSLLVSRFCNTNNKCLCNNLTGLLQNNNNNNNNINNSLQNILSNTENNNDNINLDPTNNNNNDNNEFINNLNCGCGRNRIRRF